jgi:hypothetical protein
MSEPVEPTFTPEAPAPAAPAPAARPAVPAAAASARPATAAAAAPAAPARPLPSQEDIADWIHGKDMPLLGALFEGLNVARFDALVMQVRKEELIPQHWQAISDRALPDDLTFERLPEVGGLRIRYKNQELSRRRIAPLRLAWRELAGRRPAMWTVADLFAAMRRLYEHNAKVDWTDLLTAVRDVWRGLELPIGREQLEVLWSCLALIRKNTKK